GTEVLFFPREVMLPVDPPAADAARPAALDDEHRPSAGTNLQAALPLVRRHEPRRPDGRHETAPVRLQLGRPGPVRSRLDAQPDPAGPPSRVRPAPGRGAFPLGRRGVAPDPQPAQPARFDMPRKRNPRVIPPLAVFIPPHHAAALHVILLGPPPGPPQPPRA